jgi:hypothetical protein
LKKVEKYTKVKLFLKKVEKYTKVFYKIGYEGIKKELTYKYLRWVRELHIDIGHPWCFGFMVL